MYSKARQYGCSPLRPAFTLVELLVVMGVLALMSSMVLVGLASAAEQARVARTRGQIQKIHELLMTRWDDYRYRRVEPSKTGNVRDRQRARVDKIRELMRMEMPCRLEDIQYGSGTNGAVSGNEPALWNRYQRAVNTRAGGIGSWTTSFDDSECLYMILESIQDGETNGLDYFKASEIGDTDGDGMSEILDAWGTPIRFLRWAPGYAGVRSNLHRNDQPDPFDPLNVRDGKLTDSSGNYLHFPLYPLVVSAGPDQALDIVLRFTGSSAMKGTVVPSTNYPVPNNPYVSLASADATGSQLAGLQFGTEGDANGNGVDEYYDNISNHALVISGNAN
ncbi:prepilin-type N-terminal cleavage/methylation domain-containing protein [Bremerella cremea]|uniref:Prepilin-type N-terminal cleavage/methylation domain-containing protein n=1 Tax=Bremerella cremea TaxID=1031537 RepID=A0A368KVT2_9BACT|nr:prepilin-type N-terminal cleavage/methylation domain-containing protein [Bremerella cremea]RCS54553.1 prepilin-type N-terminal cleavage/methylation domain-containing protein [Bremerella cremea]